MSEDELGTEMEEITESEEAEKIAEAEEAEDEENIGYCKYHGRVKGKIGRDARLRCPICNRLVKMKKPEEKQEVETFEAETVIEPEEEFEEVEEFVSPEEEFVDKALQYLKKELSRYGICRGRMLNIVLSTLQLNPEILKNANTLHMHIKSIVRTANDYLLSLVIRGLFNKYGDLLARPQPVFYPEYATTPNYVSPAMSPISPYPSYQPNPASTLPYPTPTPPSTIPYPTQQEPKKKYVVAIDGQTVEVYDYKEYLALKEWEERRKIEEEERKRREEEHQLRLRKLEEEIKKIARESEREKEKAEEKPSEDKTVSILNSRISSLEQMINKLLSERDQLTKKIEELENRRREEEIKALRAELEKLRKVAEDPFSLITEYESKLRRLGYLRGGRSLLDIIADTQKNIDETIKMLVSKLPAQPVTGIRVPGRYTEEERIKKISEIKDRIRMTEEAIKAEEEYLRSLQKLYSKRGQTGQSTQ